MKQNLGRKWTETVKRIGAAAAVLLLLCACARAEKTVSGYESGESRTEAPGESRTEAPGESRTEASEESGAETPGESRTEIAAEKGTETPEGVQTEPAAPRFPGALRVSGSQLTASDGTPVQLRGVSTHGIAWYPDYINEDCFGELHREWKANVVRLAMYTEEYGGYCAGGDRESLKQLIRSGVEAAAAQEMYVIIDWHILSDGNPNTHLEEAKEFFREMAETYAPYDHVIYEICNEPNGGVSWSEIKAYAEEVIGVIREYDDAVILVGTPTWSQDVGQAADDPIEGYENIMYTLHFYAATHTDGLRAALASAADRGLPLFVSEFGICDASGGGAIDEAQARRWIDLLDQYGISYVAWNLSNKAETCAMLQSGCAKTSGFTEDDLSASGRWVFETLRQRDAQEN